MSETTLPPEDAVIRQHLCERLALSSVDQIERVECPNLGFQSVQSKYLVTDNDGQKLGIFVKTVSGATSEVVDKEILMYETIVPEVTKFLRKYDEQLADRFEGLFVKYYGSTRDLSTYDLADSSPSQSLFLEDLSLRETLKLRSKSNSEDAYDTSCKLAIAEHLAMINAAMYAWQRQCFPTEMTSEEMKEKYPVLKNYPLTLDTPEFGDIVANVPKDKATAVVLQFSMSHTTKFFSTFVGDVIADETARDSYMKLMGRLQALGPHLGDLIPKVRDQESEYFCPILGDVNPYNIALDKDEKDTIRNVLFYDFGLAGVASVCMEIHWFIALSKFVGEDCCSGAILATYMDQFVQISGKLGSEVDRSSLQLEYENTMLGETVMSLIVAAFVIFMLMKRVGVEKELVDQFVRTMTMADVDRDQDKIRCTVSKVMSREKIVELTMLMVAILDGKEKVFDELEELLAA